ncbi:MAG: response regulator, partial [Alphaproteobacteria bacterium]|nr:response regulator [Alphaproteobacteria bacterium]
FEVTDSGIGIAPEHLGSIFESYSQADNTVTRRFGGTGLGLSITRQLIEHMGGEIHVASELGKGSRFWFELPFPSAEQDVTSAGPSLEFEDNQVILLTPDIEKLSDVEAALIRWGVVAASVPSPDAVVASISHTLARGGPRAVILLDASLPNATQAIEYIRAETADREPVFVHITDPATALDVELPLPLTEIRTPVDETMLFRALRLARTFVGPVQNQDIDAGRLDNRTSVMRDLNVLLVEDNAVNRKVISKIITRAGHRAVVVENGDAALDALDAQTFDVVLMDVNIPGLSGPETTKLYRFASMGDDHLPIIALTADATLETREQCLAAGMDTVVTKPVEARVLIDAIEAIASRYGKKSDAEGIAAAVKASAQLTPPPHGQPTCEPTMVQASPLRVVTDPPLDFRALNSLRALGDDAFMASVIGDFLVDAQAIVQSLQQAVDQGDLSRVREHSHALRSSSTHVGAIRMHVVAKEIHDLKPAELDTKGRAVVEALNAEFQVLRTALEEELASIDASSS